MQNKDALEKDVLRNHKNFSSIINYCLYNNENIIKEDDLIDLNTELINIDNTHKTSVKRYRDIYKKVKYRDSNNTYLLIGLENQTNMDPYMVIRSMGYDYFSYNTQISNIEKNMQYDIIKLKEMKIFPVITFILYFSPNPWTGPKDLYNLLNIKKDMPISKYIQNYQLNIIEPCYMKDEDIDKLTDDLKIIFKFIKVSNDKEKIYKLVHTDDLFINIKTTVVTLLNEILKLNLKINKEDEVTNMCKGMDDLILESKNEGIIIGKNEGIIIGKTEGIIIGKNEGIIIGKNEGIIIGENEIIMNLYNKKYDIKEIADIVNKPIDYVNDIIESFKAGDKHV